MSQEFLPTTNTPQGTAKKRGRPRKTDTPSKDDTTPFTSTSSSLPRQSRSRKKKYTVAELDERNNDWERRYKDLLLCARRGDIDSALMFPKIKEYELPMVKNCESVHVKVELLDIYHYLVGRQDDLKQKVSYRNFGPMIGIDLAEQTFGNWIKNESRYRANMLNLPKDAYYIMESKNAKVEMVLVRWLEAQRTQNIPVSAKMIKSAAEMTHTVLQDWFVEQDGDVGVDPSFSASWFDAFKKRNRITYCQLRGEAGSVDLTAIEPELAEIRHLCSQYDPENIYNCDETGLYLKELNYKSYTVAGKNAGGKPHRDCRVSLLVCVNASGSSILKAEEMSALRPLVLATSFARYVQKEALDRMTIKITPKGWMNRAVFMEWLGKLDDQLKVPSLLLLDSCPAHNDIDMRDSVNNIPWTHLRIRRLPVNSTSVTQPLDAGVFSVFKRAFLELLSQETSIVRTFDKTKAISNGHAWSLLPYAWNQVKASTIRNCFAHTPVLPDEMREKLRRRLCSKDEQLELSAYSRRSEFKEKETTYFQHLIAEAGIAHNWNLKNVGEKDAQELADEDLIRQPVHVEQEVEVEEQGEEEEEEEEMLLPPQRNRTINDGDPCSSPIGEEDFEGANGYLREITGGRDLFSFDTMIETRGAMQSGSVQDLKVRTLLKQLVRAAAEARNVRNVSTERDGGGDSDLFYSSDSGEGSMSGERSVVGEGSVGREGSADGEGREEYAFPDIDF